MPTLVLKLLMHSRLQAGQCTQQHTDRIKPSHQYNGSEAEIQAFSTLASINKIWVEYLLLLGTNTHSQDRGMAKTRPFSSTLISPAREALHREAILSSWDFQNVFLSYLAEVKSLVINFTMITISNTGSYPDEKSTLYMAIYTEQ